MKIYQAMKAKKKMITEIDQLKSKIRENNSYPAGKKINYDAKTLMSQLEIKSAQLIDMKDKIMKATMPIYGKLHEMAELKSMASFIKGIPHAEGTITQHSYRGDSTPQEYHCVINEVALAEMVKGYESRIERLQEEIDGFNHTTDI